MAEDWASSAPLFGHRKAGGSGRVPDALRARLQSAVADEEPAANAESAPEEMLADPAQYWIQAHPHIPMDTGKTLLLKAPAPGSHAPDVRPEIATARETLEAWNTSAAECKQ